MRRVNRPRRRSKQQRLVSLVCLTRTCKCVDVPSTDFGRVTIGSLVTLAGRGSLHCQRDGLQMGRSLPERRLIHSHVADSDSSRPYPTPPGSPRRFTVWKSVYMGRSNGIGYGVGGWVRVRVRVAESLHSIVTLTNMCTSFIQQLFSWAVQERTVPRTVPSTYLLHDCCAALLATAGGDGGGDGDAGGDRRGAGAEQQRQAGRPARADHEGA